MIQLLSLLVPLVLGGADPSMACGRVAPHLVLEVAHLPLLARPGLPDDVLHLFAHGKYFVLAGAEPCFHIPETNSAMNLWAT